MLTVDNLPAEFRTTACPTATSTAEPAAAVADAVRRYAQDRLGNDPTDLHTDPSPSTMYASDHCSRTREQVNYSDRPARPEVVKMPDDRPAPRPFVPYPTGQETPTYSIGKPNVSTRGDHDEVSFLGAFAPRTGPSSSLPPTVPGYEIISVLGRGGMGVVYQARQIQLNRYVALKVVVGGGHSTDSERARLFAEAEVLASVAHPNIVQVFEVSVHDGHPFIALELCPGGTLTDRLANGPMFPREAAGLVAAIARGVEVVHSRGVIHRDLKPANVLFGPDGTPKVADFGVAKRDDTALTATGDVVGTPSYMAPEQAGDAKRVGPTADVYALGAVLYECLTGRPPFKGPTPAATLIQVLSKEPVSPRSLMPRVPADIETICLKCLDKNPDRRYLSAGALADDLHRFLAGRPVDARPVGPLGRAGRWVLRNRLVAGLLAAVAVSVMGGVVATVLKYRDEVAQRTAAETARSEADDQRRRAEAALDRARRETAQTEKALLRGLLRPIAREPQVPIDVDEDGAFQDLAALPDSGARVRFVETALAVPSGPTKLLARRDEVVFAVAGMDRAQGERVLRAIREVLKSPKSTASVKLAAAALVPALPPGDPDIAGRAATVLWENIVDPQDPKWIGLALRGFQSLVPQLDDRTADRLFRQTVDALVTRDQASKTRILSVFAPLAERLPPGSASGAVSPLARAWAAEPPHFLLHATALATAAGQLEPSDADAIANAVTFAVRNYFPDRSSDDDGPSSPDYLHPALSVVERLPPAVQRAVRDSLTKRIREGEPGTSADLALRMALYGPGTRTPDLFAPAGPELVARYRSETRLEAQLAMASAAVEIGGQPLAELAVGRMLPVYTLETDEQKLRTLGNLLIQSAMRLPEEKRRAVANTITGRVPTTAGTPLFQTCVSIAAQIPDPWPPEHAAPIAKYVLAEFRAADTPQKLAVWVGKLGTSARFLTSQEAESLASAFEEKIARPQPGNPYPGSVRLFLSGRLDSATALKRLGPILEKYRQGAATPQLAQQIQNENDQIVSTLCSRLDPADAEKLFAGDIEALFAPQPPPPKSRVYPARYDNAVVNGLSPASALRLIHMVLARYDKGGTTPAAAATLNILSRLAPRVSPGDALPLAKSLLKRAADAPAAPGRYTLENVSVQLLGMVPADQATPYAEELVGKLASSSDVQTLQLHSRLLEPVLRGAPPTLVSRAAETLAARIGKESRPEVINALGHILNQVMQRVPAETSTAIVSQLMTRAAAESNRTTALTLFACCSTLSYRARFSRADPVLEKLVVRWLAEPDKAIRSAIRQILTNRIEQVGPVEVNPDLGNRAADLYTADDPQDAGFPATILSTVADSVPENRVDPLVNLILDRSTPAHPGNRFRPGARGGIPFRMLARIGRAAFLDRIRTRVKPTDDPNSHLLGLIPSLSDPVWSSGKDERGWADDTDWLIAPMLAAKTPDEVRRWLPHLRAISRGFSPRVADRWVEAFEDRFNNAPSRPHEFVNLEATALLLASASDATLVRVIRRYGISPIVDETVRREFGRRAGHNTPAARGLAGIAAAATNSRPFATRWELVAWLELARPGLLTK